MPLEYKRSVELCIGRWDADGRTHEGVTTSATWDPAQYLKWSDHRLRPAVDLLQRVAVANPTEVVDLGCGTGNVTGLLRARWPAAHVTGVDASASMRARLGPECRLAAGRRRDLGAARARRRAVLERDAALDR